MKVVGLKSVFMLILTFSCFMISDLKAQTDSLFSKWLELSEEDASILGRIEDLYDNPVNINKATKTVFRKIPFLSPVQIDSIIAYRKDHKRFKSIAELEKILGSETYTLLYAFFTISNSPKQTGLVKQKNYFPIGNQKEIKNYNGGNWYNASKLHYTFSPFTSCGLITHKDIGEANTFDYFIGYISYSGPSWKVILGKFNFQFGHGLAFANPFSTQKSSMVLNPLKNSEAHAGPSLSTAENSGMFGLYAYHPGWKGIQLHTFVSGKTLDARLDETKSIITGIDYDGYHRTDSEEHAQDRIIERTLTVAATIPLSKYFDNGLLLYSTQYTPKIRLKEPIISESDYRRQYYGFSGNHINQFSYYYNTQYEEIRLSGEYVSNLQSSNAFSQKFLLRQKSFQFGACYWVLGKDFQSPYGSMFDENSAFPRAQQGFYIAGKIRLSKYLHIKSYKFFKKDLWRTYFNPMPQSNDEWLLEATVSKPRKKYTFRLRQKSATTSAHITKTRQTIYRLHYSWTPNKKIRLQNRLAFTSLTPENERGFYIFQDLKFSTWHWLTIYGRITFFKTDSFLSALYEYENDLPGSYANYPLYNQGHKWYFMFTLTPQDFIKMWVKLRYSKMQDSSGESRLKRELRCQADIYFK